MMILPRFRSVLLAIVLLLATAGSRAADDLWSLLAAQDSASGRFLQELYDEEGELVERSSGRYAVLRPHYFRWEIDYPDRQLLLVAQDTLWHYDLDLATATRRTVDDDAAFAPLQLLGGDVEKLRQQFSVTAFGPGSYRLQPTFPGAGFALVEMAWEGKHLTAMDVLDRSGQRLQLSLTPDEDVAPPVPGDFDFSVPEGVEIYDDGG